MKHVIGRSVQYCFQLLILLVSKIALQPFTRVNTAGVKPEYIQKAGYLIVSNHRRALDPFVVCGGLPFKTILRILPVGFMTHNAFYDSPFRPLLWLAGCYPAKNPKGQHKTFGIDGSAHLLRQGYSLCIFPEGTRVRDRQRGEARWGVVKIHEQAPDIRFILAHIEYNPGLKNWLQGRHRTVHYTLIEKPDYKNPESIMDEIFAL
jgi:1-acyl-sn-glycerol-3-phosphate acyltransferase